VKIFSVAVVVLFLSTFAFSEKSITPVNVKNGIAIHGYDAVEYFNSSKPVKGSEKFKHSWNGVAWYFSSESNRSLFAESPEKYAPQFGGYCAYVASRDVVSYDEISICPRIIQTKLRKRFGKTDSLRNCVLLLR
jgi:YHS domain-containing protein